MPTLNDLIDGDAQRLDTGFTFTEGSYRRILVTA